MERASVSGAYRTAGTPADRPSRELGDFDDIIARLPSIEYVGPTDGGAGSKQLLDVKLRRPVGAGNSGALKVVIVR